MMQKHRIKYTPVAVDDMDEIFSYISRDNITAAEELLEKISGGIANLAEFPRMGSVLSSDDYPIIQHGYRFIVIQPYIIFYKFSDDTVIIHRILHSRRDYLRELF